MQKTKDWAKRIQLYAIIRYDQKQKIEQDESSYKPSSGTIKNKRLSKTNPTISHHQVRSKTKDWAKRIQLYAIIRYDQKQKIEQDESNYKPSSGTIKNKRLSKANPTISHHQVRSKTKDWKTYVFIYSCLNKNNTYLKHICYILKLY